MYAHMPPRPKEWEQYICCLSVGKIKYPDILNPWEVRAFLSPNLSLFCPVLSCPVLSSHLQNTAVNINRVWKIIFFRHIYWKKYYFSIILILFYFYFYHAVLPQPEMLVGYLLLKQAQPGAHFSPEFTKHCD